MDRTVVAADRVRAALGIEPTEEALLGRLADQLGADELAVATAAVEQAPADRRLYAMAGLAAAALAVELLGTGWWHVARARNASFFLPADDRSPAVLLRSPRTSDDRTNIELLEAWAKDDVADHQWGPPAGYVDLDHRYAIVRSTMPENARPGDRFLMSCAVGRRVEVEVRENGRLGLTAGSEHLRSSAEHLSDDWAVATNAADRVRQALGIRPTADALFDRLAGQVGRTEAMVAAAAVGQAPEDRRHFAAAGIAAASLAMDDLGVTWWRQARVRTGVTGVPADTRSPATLLRSPAELGHNPHAELLGKWAQDDAADHLWGPPVAHVDLNPEPSIQRVPVPALAQPRDEFLLAWGPGLRVWAVVEDEPGGPVAWTDYEIQVSPVNDLVGWWVTAQSVTPGRPARPCQRR